MSQGSEIEEIVQRTSGVVAAMISASTQMAEALIELRIRMLREGAAQDRAQARTVRAQTRAYHQADAAVWKAAMRPQWWRDAGAEDISRVWRAASTWAHVDPRAAAAREVVVERLAERGVHVDREGQAAPSPDDVAWLSDALDRAATEQAESVPDDAPARPDGVRAPDAPTVIDGEVGEPGPARPARSSTAEREQRAAAHVRAAWPAERAERVMRCQAWGALVTQLDQLETAGHDVEALLHGVPGFVDRAHTPAAFAFRSIQDRLDGMVDLGTQSSTAAAAESGTGGPAARADRGAAQAGTTPGEGPDRAAAQSGNDGGSGAGKAAQVATQAYPLSTSEAVENAAGQAAAGTAPGTGPALARPGPQQDRDEPGR